jgi:class 3 adenylate cyclase
MIDMMRLLNADRLAQAKTEIRIGIGIASGQVIAGYTGTTRRATYTCVGDTVNLAARLESHTKVVGKPILIDGATQSALSSAIKTDPEGLVQLKGKTVEVPVFSVPVDQKG